MINVGKDPGKKRRVAIYIRVSTAEQKMEGYGLEAQKKRLLDYVNSNRGLNLTTAPEWIFEDVHTGSEITRDGLQRMLSGIRQGRFDAVLVWKIDRLSRSLKHLLSIFEDLERNGISFISVQENIDFKGPIGKLIFQIFGAIAQFERELIKGRTLMGKRASAELGNWTGSFIPYGYRPIPNQNGKGKKLEIIPEENKWVKQIFEWYIYDGYGFGQIADKLNDVNVSRGIHVKRAGAVHSKWTDDIIRKMIQNPLYRGEYIAIRHDENGLELPEDDWTIVGIPPSVSEFTFQQAQYVRERKTANRTNRNYLLSGKLKDATFDPPLAFVGVKRTKGGLSYRRKQLKKDEIHFPSFEIPAKQIEDYVWDKIVAALKTPDAFVENYFAQKYTDTSRLENLEAQLAGLRERKMNIEMGIARIENGFDNGVYDAERAKQKLAKRNKELSDVESKIQDAEDELNYAVSVDIERKKIKAASEQIKYRILHADQRQKKILINMFLEKVELRRRTEGKIWAISAEVYFRFNPDRFPLKLVEDRTHQPLHQAKKEVKKINSRLSGQRARGGYFLYQFTVDFGYQTYLVNKGGRMMPVREVVLEERAPSESKLTAVL